MIGADARAARVVIIRARARAAVLRLVEVERARTAVQVLPLVAACAIAAPVRVARDVGRVARAVGVDRARQIARGISVACVHTAATGVKLQLRGLRIRGQGVVVELRVALIALRPLPLIPAATLATLRITKKTRNHDGVLEAAAVGIDCANSTALRIASKAKDANAAAHDGGRLRCVERGQTSVEQRRVALVAGRPGPLVTTGAVATSQHIAHHCDGVRRAVVRIGALEVTPGIVLVEGGIACPAVRGLVIARIADVVPAKGAGWIGPTITAAARTVSNDAGNIGGVIATIRCVCADSSALPWIARVAHNAVVAVARVGARWIVGDEGRAAAAATVGPLMPTAAVAACEGIAGDVARVGGAVSRDRAGQKALRVARVSI